MMHTVDTSRLHYTLIRYIIEHGFAPDTRELAVLLDVPEAHVNHALHRLQDAHGVVLHPNSTRVWIIHPFSLAPTLFWVRCGEKAWWGNCAWCSLGIAALLDQDCTIITTLGAQGRQVDIHIRDGQVVEASLYVHFPVPMRAAWDNVVYTCSTMLVFESEEAIDRWSEQHRIPRGDVQPIATVWDFARAWYGNHLSPDWKKWTMDEARVLFERFGLVHDTWTLPGSSAQF